MKNKLKKLKSDFLEHKFDEVLNSFSDCIEALEEEKNSNIKNYRKLFVYSIVYLVYRLKENKKEANIYLEKMKVLEVNSKKLSNRIFHESIPFTRLGIKILFQKEYYKENYSKKLLDEIRYDSGALGFVEDLFIEESGDTVGIVLMVLFYLFVTTIFIGIAIWFVKMEMVETGIAFIFLSCVGFYIYFDYKMK